MTVLARVLFGALIGATAVAPIACSSSDDDMSETKTPDADASEANDGAIEEAAADALEGGADLDAADGPSCSIEGWCHTALPAKTYLGSVWSDGSGNAWAVSRADMDTKAGKSRARILRWDGAAWSVALESPNREHSGDGVIWGSSPTDLWCQLDRVMYRGRGATPAAIVWTPLGEDAGAPTYPVAAFAGSGPDDVWALAGVAWHYSSERGWVEERGGNFDMSLSSITVSGAEVWMAGGDWSEGLLVRGRRGADGEMEWTRVTLPDLPELEGYTVPTPRIASLFVDQAGAVWLAGLHRETQDQNENEFEHDFIARGTVVGDALVYDRIFACMPDGACRGPYDHVFGLWGTGGTVYSVGDGYGAIGASNGSTWRVERISISSIPLLGPFHAVHGGGPNDVWSVGGELALHKVGKGSP